MVKTLELNAFLKSNQKTILKKLKMSLPSKDRLCKRPSGVELGLMRKRGFGGKLNLIARMKLLWCSF